MKIAILSPSQKHLQDVAATLAAEGHEVVRCEGGKSRLRDVAETHEPDLLIADGLCRDTGELAQAEYVTARHPDMAIALMCSEQTPEYLVQAMRAGVREVLPSPVSPQLLLEAVARIALKRRMQEGGRSGQVVAFVSCKGGCGATFLATNIGVELARERKVLLIDLNLQFGDALSFVHDGRPAATLADVAGSIGRLDASLLAASTVKVAPGFGVLAAPEDPTRALEIQPDHVEAVIALAARHYDFVLLDLSRTLDPAGIRAFDLASRVFAVLTPTLPAVRHADKLRQVFSSLGYPADKTRFVLNAWDRSAEIGREQVQRSLGGAHVLTLGEDAREVTGSINRGEPLVQSHRSHPLSRQIIELAQELAPQPAPHKRLSLGSIFRRA
ncbi:MAG: AAA family ATPase [Burkholderiales bacterium]|nr:AAA family ATPase [Burkholderiales bacterium]